MRKIGLFLAVILLVICFGSTLSVSAANSMQAEAKAGDVYVDGNVGRNEYASAFILTADNTTPWGGWSSLETPVTYRFAWSFRGLYIAITYDPNMVDDASLLQFVCNPGNQLSSDQQGLFFTIYPNHKVTLHNHHTLAGDASSDVYDLSEQVMIASATNNRYRTTEVLLPIDAFRMTNPNFNFTTGVMSASAVAMLHHGDTYTTGAAVSGNLENWDLNSLGLGTLTLQPFYQSGSNSGSGYDPDFGYGDYDSDYDSDSRFNSNLNKGGRAIFQVAGVLLIVFAILGVVVFLFAIILLIILCVRNHKRKKRR